METRSGRRWVTSPGSPTCHYRIVGPHATGTGNDRRIPVIVLTAALFERISDYTRSAPTGPSPGRVYRKDLHWSSPPANWVVYICERDPECDPDEKWVLHHPHKPVIVETVDEVALVAAELEPPDPAATTDGDESDDAVYVHTGPLVDLAATLRGAQRIATGAAALAYGYCADRLEELLVDVYHSQRRAANERRHPNRDPWSETYGASRRRAANARRARRSTEERWPERFPPPQEMHARVVAACHAAETDAEWPTGTHIHAYRYYQTLTSDKVRVELLASVPDLFAYFPGDPDAVSVCRAYTTADPSVPPPSLTVVLSAEAAQRRIAEEPDEWRPITTTAGKAPTHV